MAIHEKDRQRKRAQDIALFRYALVREASDETLSKSERGRIVRGLAEVTHSGPDGTRTTVSRSTIDRWIRAYRAGGFSALTPTQRRIEPRTPAGLLALACDLRREDPVQATSRSGALRQHVRTSCGSAMPSTVRLSGPKRQSCFAF